MTDLTDADELLVMGEAGPGACGCSRHSAAGPTSPATHALPRRAGPTTSPRSSAWSRRSPVRTSVRPLDGPGTLVPVADTITIRGAREHNLRNVDLELPRDQLIVFTGLSGSGKSSLAFDTIYAEGQRRYVESLSAYARQFLGQMDKPDVDFIEGLSPAISIDQKSASTQPAFHRRHDHRDLRLPAAALRAHRHPALPELRAGHHAPDAAADRRPRAAAPRGHALPGARAGRARPQGRVPRAARRARRRRASRGPGSTARSSTSRGKRDSSSATRSTRSRSSSTGSCGGPGIERRLTDSLETALQLAEGVAEVEIVPQDDERGEPETLTFSEHLACTHCGLSFDELAPRNFSFNSPYGACETLRRARHTLPGRSRAGGPRRRPLDRRRRDRAVVGVPRRVLQAGARARSATEYGFSTARRGRS